MKRAIVIVVMIMVSLSLSGCGGAKVSTADTPPTSTPILTSIVVNPASINIQIGQTATVTATGYDQNGDVIVLPSIDWSGFTNCIGSGSQPSTNPATFTGTCADSMNILMQIGDIASNTVLVTVTASNGGGGGGGSGAVASIGITVSSTTVTAGQSWTATATAYNSSGQQVSFPAGEPSWVGWSSGSCGIAQETATTLTATDTIAPGHTCYTGNISAAIGNSITAKLPQVEFIGPNQVVTSIAITPGSESVPAGQSVTFSTQAFDQAGNPMVTAPTFTWTNGPTDVSNTPTTFAVSASAAGIMSPVSTLTVIDAKIAKVTVDPANPTIFYSQGIQFSAVATDAYGNVVSTPFTWVNGPIFVGGSANTVQVTATAGGVTGYSTLNVTPVVVGMVISPAQTTGLPGTIIDFAATGTYSNGTTSSVIPTYSASGNAVTVTGNVAILNSRSADTVATSNVVAQLQNAIGTIVVSNTATVTVDPNPPVLTSIVVSPQDAIIQANTIGQQFNAVGLDQYSTPLQQQPVFSWTTTLGGITSTGDLTANCVNGTATVTAVSGSVSGTSSLVVTKYTPTLQTITLSPGSVGLNDSGAGNSAQLTASATDNCNQPIAETFVYASSNPNAASVSTVGLVSAVNQGQSTAQVSSTVTATAGNPTVTSNPVSVLVNPVPPPVGQVAIITITPGAVPTLMPVAEDGYAATAQLAVSATDAYGNPVTLPAGGWTNSNPTAAVVDTNGLVSALSGGTGTETMTTQIQYTAQAIGENGDMITVYSNVVNVTVAAAPQAWAMNITPNFFAGIIGTPITFTATEVDQYSDPWVGASYTWSTTSSLTLTAGSKPNIEIAQGTASSGLATVTVSDSNTNISGTASVLDSLTWSSGGASVVFPNVPPAGAPGSYSWGGVLVTWGSACTASVQQAGNVLTFSNLTLTPPAAPGLPTACPFPTPLTGTFEGGQLVMSLGFALTPQ